MRKDLESEVYRSYYNEKRNLLVNIGFKVLIIVLLIGSIILIKWNLEEINELNIILLLSCLFLLLISLIMSLQIKNEQIIIYTNHIKIIKSRYFYIFGKNTIDLKYKDIKCGVIDEREIIILKINKEIHRIKLKLIPNHERDIVIEKLIKHIKRKMILKRVNEYCAPKDKLTFADEDILHVTCDTRGNKLVFTKNGIFFINYMSTISTLYTANIFTIILLYFVEIFITGILTRIENLFKRKASDIIDKSNFIIFIGFNNISQISMYHQIINKRVVIETNHIQKINIWVKNQQIPIDLLIDLVNGKVSLSIPLVKSNQLRDTIGHYDT